MQRSRRSEQSSAVVSTISEHKCDLGVRGVAKIRVCVLARRRDDDVVVPAVASVELVSEQCPRRCVAIDGDDPWTLVRFLSFLHCV